LSFAAFFLGSPPEAEMVFPRRATDVRRLAGWLLTSGSGLSLSRVAELLDRDRSSIRRGIQLLEELSDSPAYQATFDGLVTRWTEVSAGFAEGASLLTPSGLGGLEFKSEFSPDPLVADRTTFW
jgi:hypothetical protein